jgi:hypothetical protein
MLSIRRMTLYKHGLGFFERSGQCSGPSLRLEFPARAMNDVLKSLVAISHTGQVLGLAFETPADRNSAARNHRLDLTDRQSLLELCTELRGCALHCHGAGQTWEGTLLGLEVTADWHDARLLLLSRHTVKVIKLDHLEEIIILDDTARSDIEVFLRHQRSDGERQSAVLQLSSGEHQLDISYIAPAPAWRVSYRILAIAPTDQAPNHPNERELLLQAWGLFDNTLEEDLEAIELSLVAGMPVSFRYALHQPNTPERPLITDEARTVAAPIEFGAMGMLSEPDYDMEPEFERAMPAPPPQAAFAATPGGSVRARSAKQLQHSAPSQAQGQDRGALFAYAITTPVSVGRGQSAMVPIINHSLKGRRECLYNAAKHPKNPVVSLRFANTSGTTLERGPVTVLEDGEYAGEAVIAFSPSQAEVIVPFVVELGITIREQSIQSSEVFRLAVSGGNLFAEEYHVMTTTYELDSSLTKDVEVIIEHKRNPGHEIWDSATPIEINLELARFSTLAVAMHQTTMLVKERISRWRSEHIANMHHDALIGHLRSQHIDQATFDGLHEVFQKYSKQQHINTEIQKIHNERRQFHERQSHIRQNLTSLANTGEEGKLRARFVGELGRIEDQLQQLDAREQQLRQSIAQLEHEIQGLMQRLG